MRARSASWGRLAATLPDLLRFRESETDEDVAGVDADRVATPGKLMATICAAFDQYESDMNSYRTMTAMQQNARDGFFNGSKAPFGFQLVKVTVGKSPRGKLVKDEAEAPIGRLIFSMCIEGRGAKAIATELNRRGVHYRQRSWSKDDVIRVLDEEAGAGVYYWGKWDTAAKRLRDRADWIPIEVESFVERDVFDLAQEARRGRAATESPGRTASSPLLLAGLLKCGKCGATYSKETSGKAFAGQYPHAYYNCSTFLRLRKRACGGKRVRVNVLDRIVVEHVADKLFSTERCRSIASDLINTSALLRRKTDDRRGQLRAQIEQVERTLARWEAAYEAGKDLDVVAPKLRTLRAEHEKLVETLGSLKPLTAPPKGLLTDATIENFQDTIRDIFVSADTPMTKNYLRFLVERIVVGEDRIEIQAKAQNAVAFMGRMAQEPGEVLAKESEWLRLQDSNQRPGG